jgi:lipid-A-disaccharide synthase
MLREVRARKPDAVILVDYPGFNLRFAARVHRLGTRVIYYICPQVWAWHRARIPKMAEIVDRLITIFPFEPDVFRGTGLKVDFAGHPLVDEARDVHRSAPVGLPWKGPARVALLPGSRVQEIDRILPLMSEVSRQVAAQRRDAEFLIAASSADVTRRIRARLAASGTDTPLSPASIVTGQTREVLRGARAALIASGTATVEAALMHCPMVVVYRTAWSTYWAGRLLVRVPHIAMVNIVGGREICPEFIQGRATPSAVTDALLPLIGDTRERTSMTEELRRVSDLLGPGGASDKAAELVLEELGTPPP